MTLKIYRSALVIADDLTGANDTAARFAKHGFSTIVTLDLEEAPRLLGEYDAIAVDTETRAEEGIRAYEVLRSLGCLLGGLIDDVLVYKKVDSTLRGNIAHEIRGLRDAIGPGLTIFAPAFPEQKRTTVNGVQMVDGEPVDRTRYGEDPVAPARTSRISALFEGLGGSYRHVGIAELRSRGTRADIDDHGLLSFDVEDDRDFDRIIDYTQDLQERGRILWVGSAGLAEHIARQLIFGSREGGPVLIAVGAINELTRNQVRTFADEFGPEIITVRVGKLIEDYEGELTRVRGICSVRTERDIIVTTSLDPEQVEEGSRLASRLGLDSRRFGSLLADRFGKLVAAIVNGRGWGSLGGLYVTGGDVSASILRHLGVRSLEVVGEIEPGLPVLSHAGGRMVTKAGGFGDEMTLLRAVARMKGERRQS